MKDNDQLVEAKMTVSWLTAALTFFTVRAIYTILFLEHGLGEYIIAIPVAIMAIGAWGFLVINTSWRWIVATVFFTAFLYGGFLVYAGIR